MTQIDYKAIARSLRLYYVQHPNRVCLSTFIKALKGCLNSKEAERLLDYYRNFEHILENVTTKHMKFTRHEEHFSAEAIKDIIESYPILTPKPKGRPKGFTSPAIKENLARMRAAKAAKRAAAMGQVVLEPAHDPEEDVVRVIGNPEPKNPLTEYSTEDLAAELYRRGWTITFGGIV